MEKNKTGNQFLTILLAIFFGLAAGISGGLITRSYLLNDIYSIPFYGKIDFSSHTGNESLVIKNAKSIVIEQDKQVKETIDSASKSLAGIFKKIAVPETEKAALKKFIPENNYRFRDNVAESLIITSDGWVLALGFGENLTKENVSEGYVIITNNGSIYPIDDFIWKKEASLSFIHLKDARDLPVKRFAAREDLSGGQTVVALGREDRNFLTHISNRETDNSIVKKSDFAEENLILADDLKDFLTGSFIFNLNGDLIALADGEGRVRLIDDFSPLIADLLDKKDSNRPSLGVNYIKLSEFAPKEGANASKGALIYPDSQGISVSKGSAAERAGLKDGDLIISLDNVEINKENDLARLLQKYAAGDEVTLVYRRGSTEERIKIILGQLK